LQEVEQELLLLLHKHQQRGVVEEEVEAGQRAKRRQLKMEEANLLEEEVEALQRGKQALYMMPQYLKQGQT
jgi:hypothetical protein